jgi:hypothetical protein
MDSPVISSLRADLAVLQEAGALGQDVLQAFDALAMLVQPADGRSADTTIAVAG